MADSFDLVVIGSGPGGYVAAIRASQLGMKTAIVEREALGGICLNWGCIPTKALLRTSEVYHLMQHASDFGLSAKDVGYDLPKIVERSRKVAGRLSNGVKFLMKKNKITVYEGAAKLAGKGRVDVTKDGKPVATLNAANVILATGARARALPGLEPDGKLIWTYREAMVPEIMPKSLLVIGSGAIGIEFASFYRTLGVEVTVVEVLDRILPVEDAEVSAAAQKAFEKRGLKFRVAAKVTKLEKKGAGVSLNLEAGGKAETLTADVCIVAVGIEGNVENLGLEALGVKVDRGHVVVDKHAKTNVPGLFAIGDVAGPPWLAHKASHEGIHAVEHMAGLPSVNIESPIPGCTYSDPQVASVGLTEAKAKEAGYEIKVGRYPFKNHGKAIASGDTEGFVKTVFDAKTGQLLGAHMIGHEVTEMIQGYVIAMTAELTEVELMNTVFPHPTMSEAMHEATLAAYGQALHI